MSGGPVDWRGTPIWPGATVIYGATIGRSVELVEATVAEPMLTTSGRINLDIVRRSHGQWGATTKATVHVGRDRLTIVSALPDTSLPTEAEKREAWRLARQQAAADKAAAEAAAWWSE